MKLRLFATCILTLLSTTACQQEKPAVSVIDHQADLKSLRDAELAEEQAWTAKDYEKAVNAYAPEAVVSNANAPAITGAENIRASMKAYFEDAGASIKSEIVNADVSQSGDLGYTQGTYVSTATDSATKKILTEKGKWLTIRKKQADGSWKIVQDIYNSDLPLAEQVK